MAVYRLQLLPSEDVLVDIRPHWSFLSAPLAVSLFAIAIGIALDLGIPHTSVTLHWVEGAVVAVPCAWLAVRVVRWRTSSLIVTSMRIVGCWGALSRRQWEIGLPHIEYVVAIQSPMRRLVGTGRLELGLWGDDEARWIDDVRKPVILQRVIDRRLGPPPDQDSGPE